MSRFSVMVAATFVPVVVFGECPIHAQPPQVQIVNEAHTADLTLELPAVFPAGEYTPHGYIDNPYHSMVLNRSGVIRSVPPLGFGYWLRTFTGAYGSGVQGHVNYVSLLQMSVAADDVRLVTAEDFARQRIALVSRYHSKHLMSYDFAAAELRFSFRYFLPREHTLACLVEIENPGAAARVLTLHASHIYGLWESRWWGSNGLGTRYSAPSDAALTAIWAYGDYFAMGATTPSAAHKATASAEQWQGWLHDNDLSNIDTTTLRGSGPMRAVLSYKLSVPARSTARTLICLCRGTNEVYALRELQTGLRAAVPAARQQLEHDAAFWARCPQLDGDWPAAWQHGWVYDWETLRMNVRRPLGIFKHRWDAMQIHSPRSVLGEASVDMLMMSYADPAAAQDVLLGTFADGPLPNAPCCREDGSVNMIASDGDACGTAPSWCFPFHVIRTIYATHHDRRWIRDLYPHLKAYLQWWMTHRADAHGDFHCHCDWESGQDGSKRFPDAEGGNADLVRTVDVEASMAEAFRNMVEFARVAGHAEDAGYWAELAAKRTHSVRGMFVDGWYRDFDTRTNRPFITPDHVDIMMLSPLTCGVASAEQVAACKPKFDYFRKDTTVWLEWPSFFLAYTEAAWFADLQRTAAEATADVADRIYPRIDQHGVRFGEPGDLLGYRVPGVACEFWPVSAEVQPGGEGYGWGATLPAHIIRTIMGVRETEDAEAASFYLAPALPQRLLQTGRRYTIRNLHFQGRTFAVTYEVLAGGRLRVRLEYTAPEPAKLTITARGETSPYATDTPGGRAAVSFEVENGAVLIVRPE